MGEGEPTHQISWEGGGLKWRSKMSQKVIRIQSLLVHILRFSKFQGGNQPTRTLCLWLNTIKFVCFSRHWTGVWFRQLIGMVLWHLLHLLLLTKSFIWWMVHWKIQSTSVLSSSRIKEIGKGWACSSLWSHFSSLDCCWY